MSCYTSLISRTILDSDSQSTSSSNSGLVLDPIEFFFYSFFSYPSFFPTPYPIPSSSSSSSPLINNLAPSPTLAPKSTTTTSDDEKGEDRSSSSSTSSRSKKRKNELLFLEVLRSSGIGNWINGSPYLIPLHKYLKYYFPHPNQGEFTSLEAEVFLRVAIDLILERNSIIHHNPNSPLINGQSSYSSNSRRRSHSRSHMSTNSLYYNTNSTPSSSLVGSGRDQLRDLLQFTAAPTLLDVNLSTPSLHVPTPLSIQTIYIIVHHLLTTSPSPSSAPLQALSGPVFNFLKVVFSRAGDIPHPSFLMATELFILWIQPWKAHLIGSGKGRSSSSSNRRNDEELMDHSPFHSSYYILNSLHFYSTLVVLYVRAVGSSVSLRRSLGWLVLDHLDQILDLPLTSPLIQESIKKGQRISQLLLEEDIPTSSLIDIESNWEEVEIVRSHHFEFYPSIPVEFPHFEDHAKFFFKMKSIIL